MALFESQRDLMMRLTGGSGPSPVTTDAQGNKLQATSTSMHSDAQTDAGGMPLKDKSGDGMGKSAMESIAEGVKSIAGGLLGKNDTSVHPTMTNSFGIPCPDMTHSQTIGGHPVASDVFLFENQQAFNRSKLPERPVHACGSGAFGYFETTNDMSKYTKAAFLQGAGKRTPMFARFSTVTYGREFPDEARNPRGLAWKFYTEEGNYDVLTINFPIFFNRDPMLGPSVIRSQQRNPNNFQVNLDSTFDFMSLVPETMHANLWFWSDHGTPKGWMTMDGFPCHTFRWVNAAGESIYVKYRYKSLQGVQNLSFEEAQMTCGVDPDFSKREMWQHIDNGGTAEWMWQVQFMTEEQAAASKWDPFDNTKLWPESEYPYHDVGKIVINRNPENYHRDVEQAAFDPGRMVPGVEPSPDPLLQFRMFLYRDSQMNRLGVNYHQIPVNCPFMTKNYHPFTRDGAMRVDTNGGAEQHYFPNSSMCPMAALGKKENNWKPVVYSSTMAARVATSKHETSMDDDFMQARMFLQNTLDEQGRKNLVHNIAKSLQLVTRRDIVMRWMMACVKVDEAFAHAILSECYALGKAPWCQKREAFTMEQVMTNLQHAPTIVDREKGYVPLPLVA